MSWYKLNYIGRSLHLDKARIRLTFMIAVQPCRRHFIVCYDCVDLSLTPRSWTPRTSDIKSSSIVFVHAARLMNDQSYKMSDVIGYDGEVLSTDDRILWTTLLIPNFKAERIHRKYQKVHVRRFGRFKQHDRSRFFRENIRNQFPVLLATTRLMFWREDL